MNLWSGSINIYISIQRISYEYKFDIELRIEDDGRVPVFSKYTNATSTRQQQCDGSLNGQPIPPEK